MITTTSFEVYHRDFEQMFILREINEKEDIEGQPDNENLLHEKDIVFTMEKSASSDEKFDGKGAEEFNIELISIGTNDEEGTDEEKDTDDETEESIRLNLN